MSLWRCELCGWEGRTSQKSGHERYRCPKQGNLLRSIQRQEKAIANEAAREAEKQKALAEAVPPPPEFFQYLVCVCGCGTEIGQVKGQKKKQFVDHDHYEAWRRAALKVAAGEDVDLVAERKHAEEVAAVAAKNAAIARAAQAVPMVTGEASFRLWAQCLDFNVGDAASVAA